MQKAKRLKNLGKLLLFVIPQTVLLSGASTATAVELPAPPPIPHIEYVVDKMGNKIPEDMVQTFKASPNVVTPQIERSTYSATTPEEIAQKKLPEQQQEQQEVVATVASIYGYAAVATAPELSTCKVEYCWPLTNYTYSQDINGFQSGSRPEHQGFDMLAPAMTPIYAVTDGVVIISSESHSGYGVAVVIDSNKSLGKLSLTYGHMSYGTRAVEVGQTVHAGQIIGFVGSTGRSTANHLHLEVNLNGGNIDPHQFLNSHAN